MLTVFETQARRLLGVLVPVALLALGIAAPALAAPEWQIAMKAENPWGLTGKVDPFTGSATTFARPSGADAYTVTVKNAGSSSAGGVSVGTVLTCAGPAGASALSYEWLANGVVIAGATSASFKVSPAQAQAQVQCEVGASSGEGLLSVAFSTPAPVAPLPATAAPSPGTPTLTGAAHPGQELSCATGGWSGGPTLTRQWLENGTAIAGATGAQYTLPAEALGSAIQCEVTGMNAGGTVLAVTASVAVVPGIPAASVAPKISPSASPAANHTKLTCATGTWSDSPSAYSYQWLRDGEAIAGATGNEYEVQEAGDREEALQCEVTATGSEGSAMALSKKIIGIAKPTPELAGGVLLAAPPVGGTHTVGQTLNCKGGQLTAPAASSYTYQWVRNGQPIANASEGPTTSTSAAYTLTAADLNHSIQCEVTVTNESGSQSAISASEGSVVTAAPASASASVSAPAQVAVADRLPEGLEFSRQSLEEAPPWEGTGWQCQIPPGDDTMIACTRTDALVAGASYPTLTLRVQVGSEAPDVVDNAVTVDGGGAAAASASETTEIETIPFGVASLTAGAFAPGAVFDLVNGAVTGETVTQAGAHPEAIAGTVMANLTTSPNEGLSPAGGAVRDLDVELPPGLLGNPQNAPRCPVSVFNGVNGSLPGWECPEDSIVGFLDLSLEGDVASGPLFERICGSCTSGMILPLYNLVPPPGHPALFGFTIQGEPYDLYATVRTDGDYGVTVTSTAIPAIPAIQGAELAVCDDGVEGKFKEYPSEIKCKTPEPGAVPFLTYPTRCTGPAPITYVKGDSWSDPGVFAQVGLYANGTPLTQPSIAGGPTIVDEPTAESFATGCENVPFEAGIGMSPSEPGEGGTSEADEPTGTTFRLSVPQPNTNETLASSSLEDATVTLPQGLSLDAPAAGGLQACTDGEFGLGLTVEPTPVAKCPLASQVGTVEVFTPLLPDRCGGEGETACQPGESGAPLDGQVFVGQPECGAETACTDANAERGEIFRLFLQMHSKKLGVDVKVAGNVAANPLTGQLQARFEQTPQLPFSELIFKFKGGPRAPLANPQTCGTFTTTSDLTPWSAPGEGGLSGEEAIAGTPDATPSASYEVSGCGAGMGFSPSFAAGTQSTQAGAYTNLGVTFSREDREQDLSGLSVSMPAGLLAKIAGIPLCGEAQANAGACGSQSRLGGVTAVAGAGSDPYSLKGSVYLTSGHRGAPFGLSIVVPAVAGPFNLGDVVVRAAINIDPRTAAVTVSSDPLPQIVDGVPVRLRDVHVDIDREDFIFNATSCAQKQFTGTISGTPPPGDGEAGKRSSIAAPYEVGGCTGLAFKPSFSASTSASHSRADGAQLKVVVKSGQGQADLAAVRVELPKKLPSELRTLQHACAEAQFEADPAGCPSESVVGKAEVNTPVLPVALEGPAYFVSRGTRWPELIIVLQGDGVTIQLEGETFISRKGITSSTFKAVPDAPFTRFALTLPKGPYSALAGNGNLCHVPLLMPTRIIGQNGASIAQNTRIKVTGCSAAKQRSKRKRSKRAQKLARALRACRKHSRTTGQRHRCEKQARRRYRAISRTSRQARRLARRRGAMRLRHQV